MTEHSLEVPTLEAETVRLAQITVAAHATDPDDLVQLLDMLGIRVGAPATPPEPEPEPEPEPSQPAFRPPSEHVPVADLIGVVLRLKSAKGWSRREIAKRAEVNESTLANICAPSNPHKFVRKEMYIAVLRLAQEHSV